MHFALYMIVWVALGFLAGSIPFGWLVARSRGVDIRKVGSGNIGMTNVWRALGWRAGVSVFLLDVCKGFLPILGLGSCLPNLTEGYLPAGWVGWLKLFVGLAAILGHTFTPWLKFKGGKGIATGLGVLMGLMQFWVLAPLAGFALIVFTTRFVGLGSVMAALLAGATILTVPELRQYWLLGVITPVLICYTHRGNLQRIMAGTEPKVGRQKTPPTAAADTTSDPVD